MLNIESKKKHIVLKKPIILPLPIPTLESNKNVKV